MYFAKNYLVNQLRFVLLFPNFQRSFGLIQTPFFLTECEGKSLYFTTQILFDFFLKNFLKNFKKTGRKLLKNYPFFVLGVQRYEP